ncbi:MFS monocarboxylate [Phlyctema vagabunda]|uniref:MFS monocarboxylate n=1 Tax=Phlyctema vagabunda TaxID=108571 RepID=A0ABR4PL64_9HELO
MTTFTAPLQLDQNAHSQREHPEEALESNVDDGENHQRDGLNYQQLKPVDGGLAAWKMLIAAFVFEALFWGFPTAFGVFQNYYSSLPQFKGDSRVALIGTIAQGLCYLGAPFSAALTKRFPKYQRQQIWLGWPLCIFGLLAASFATTLPGLIATQGVMYGVGFVTLTYPIISMVNEWWVTRKGMAFGLISSASGASGAAMPFIIEALLQRYGYKTTLRACAVGLVLLTAPLLPFLVGRLPPAERSAVAKTNWSFISKPLFWVYCTSTLVQGLGFFFPPIYLPSYATEIGLRSSQGALLLCIMAIAQTLGQFAFGYLSDKQVSVSILCIICSVMATVASLVLWGLSKSLSLLLVFSMIYGFFGFGFGTMRVAMGRAVSTDPSATVATYSILVFLQGVGNILAGPISVGLLSQTVAMQSYGVLRYRSLVIFTGACMFGSALVIGLWHARPTKLRVLKLGSS